MCGYFSTLVFASKQGGMYKGYQFSYLFITIYYLLLLYYLEVGFPDKVY